MVCRRMDFTLQIYILKNEKILKLILIKEWEDIKINIWILLNAKVTWT